MFMSSYSWASFVRVRLCERYMRVLEGIHTMQHNKKPYKLVCRDTQAVCATPSLRPHKAANFPHATSTKRERFRVKVRSLG